MTEPMRMELKLKIEIPNPETGIGARVADAETGEPLSCRSIDLHIDSDLMTPILTLEIFGCDFTAIGTWRGELVAERSNEVTSGATPDQCIDGRWEPLP